MKVLFLDFDGVLNSDKWSLTHPPGLTYRTRLDLDPACVTRVADFLRINPDLQVVICSDWRKLPGHNLEYLKAELAAHNFPVSQIVGVTPVVHNQIREAEVNAYLQLHPEVTGFVCLDNDAHFGKLNVFLVQTDEAVGVQDHDIAALSLKLSAV